MQITCAFGLTAKRWRWISGVPLKRLDAVRRDQRHLSIVTERVARVIIDRDDVERCLLLADHDNHVTDVVAIDFCEHSCTNNSWGPVQCKRHYFSPGRHAILIAAYSSITRYPGGNMSVEIVATTYQMSDGLQEVELTHDGQTKRFTGEGLSEYIEALAAVRANLLPLVRLDVPVGRSVPTQLDPNFSTAAKEMVNGSSLYFRHSGFGSLGVIIPFDKLVAPHLSFGTQIEEAKISRARPLN